MPSRIVLVTVTDVAKPEYIDAAFDNAASQHLPAIAVFPELRSEEALIQQLRVLADGERWTVTRQTVATLTTSDVLIGIRWQTSSPLVSTPMGFGPFPAMPVTRRAPFPCIATWPGGHENPFGHRRKPSPTSVDFLDAPPGPMEKAEFDELWSSSVKRTGDYLGETGDSAGHYRTVAFRLSATTSCPFPSNH